MRNPAFATSETSREKAAKHKGVNPFVKASQLKTKVNGYSVARSHALNHQTLQHLAAHHREKFLKAFKYVQANVVSNITVSHGIASTKHDGISAYFFWE